MRLLALAFLALVACKDDATTDDSADPIVDADGDGYDLNDDCDDNDAAVYPGADEVCDGVDNNCDGVVDDDAIDQVSVYGDSDGDGYGAPDQALDACPGAEGVAESGDDCDDGDPAINPGADEVCDEIDNNCDGVIDADAIDQTTLYADEDGDGFGLDDEGATSCEHPAGMVGNSDDCDDGDAAVNPDADEVCNGVDDDCDGAVDDADDSLDASSAASWYADVDGDGYGDASGATLACEQPSGTSSDGSDCDDAEAAVSPAASEVCDGLDNDCDGAVDDDDGSLDASTASAWYSDGDGDGYGGGRASWSCDAGSGQVADSSDCDDSDPAVNPAAAELCDGVDNDCDALVDSDDSSVDASSASTWYADADSDGFGDASSATLSCEQPSGTSSDDSDCDDADPWTYPGAPEICDEASNDCDDSSWTSDAGVVSFIDTTGALTDLSADFAAGTYGSPAAVTLSASGDLFACEGTYYVGLELSGAEVNVYGLAGSDYTVLSGGDADNVIELPGANAVVALEGLTLTEGYGCYGPAIAGGSVNSCSSTGASFSYHAYLDLSLYDVVITDNEVALGGSVVTVGYYATLYMEDSQIAENADTGLQLYQADGTCVGSTSTDAGIWGNAGYGLYFYNYGSDVYTFTSSACDFGSGATDNTSGDVYFYDATNGSGSYTFGDDASFTCATSQGACQ